MPVSGPIHRLSRAEARRIAVRAQLLDSARPTDLLDLVRHLTLLQVEPTAAVAPSAEVVAWSRLGPRFRRAELEDAVTEGTLVELHSMLRPAEDIALYQAEMAVWPGPGELRDWEVSLRDWVEANDDTRRDILDKLYDEGPLPTSALPDTTLIPWESSGWNNDRNVRMLLDRMVQRGEVATAGYDGRQRLWDLAERVYPDVEPVPYDDAMRIRSERRLHSLGIARAKATKAPQRAQRRRPRRRGRGDRGPPGPVAGRPVVPRAAASPDARPCCHHSTGWSSTASGWTELFEFDYQLEMYKPAAKRRWGYWALPILYEDRLVGKLDATAVRSDGVLRVDAIHEDGDWSRTMRGAVEDEVRSLAEWLGSSWIWGDD